MKLKVCGLKHAGNIKNIQNLNVNFTGFIFYNKSTRNIELSDDLIKTIKELSVQKVGVFVDEKINEILRLKTLLGLDYIQLHGNESLIFCKELSEYSKIIKVFKVHDNFDFDECIPFDFADYFLFETKGKLMGGNGITFDWKILNNYKMDVPFLLSGGIGMKELTKLEKFRHPMLKVIDVNSAFEIEPGLKNIELIKEFKNELPSR
jgi:phosphoribosylanthranilate isomerase